MPKTKFYEHGNVRTALREKFVDDVQRITWAYKLADDTIRLRGTTPCPRSRSSPSRPRARMSPTTCSPPSTRPCTSRSSSRSPAATGCAPSPPTSRSTARHPTIGTYFTTDWQPADAPRRPLPTALDLPSLYEAILGALLPVHTRAGETVSEATDRLDRARKLQREIAALEKKLRTEPQLNRKIELRRQIKERTAVLAELTDPAPSNKE